MKYIYQTFILFFFFCPTAFATHLKGGEIKVSHISGQKYKVTVLLYEDAHAAGTDGINEIQVCMGDKNVITFPRISVTEVPNTSEVLLTTFEGYYTYAVLGTYQITFSENNRSGDVLNFVNASQTPLFVWTWLYTDIHNSTPTMPALSFNAGVKQVFTLDLKATDTDGDSLAYRVQKISRPSPGTCAVRRIDQTYIYPNDLTKTGTFTIKKGDNKLVWTAPEKAGNYLFAVVVEEWRDGVNISETYREGTIFVTDRPGETVEIPPYDYAENPGGLVTSIPNLDSQKLSIAVEAYPNPAQDFVTVKVYSKKLSNINVQLIDLNGRVLKEVKSTTPQYTIQQELDLRSYTRGLYLIKVQNDTEAATQKIVH